MNFVFISPQFPQTFWNFCDRLKKNGVNVLGIGDTPYDNLSQNVKDSLTEYYWLASLENYEDVFRAVAFFSFKYGKIDWIESNNEYWLELDARLRTDFNVTTGVKSDRIEGFKSKALMKKQYEKAGIPTARQLKVPDHDTAALGRDFREEMVRSGLPADRTSGLGLKDDELVFERLLHVEELRPQDALFQVHRTEFLPVPEQRAAAGDCEHLACTDL